MRYSVLDSRCKALDYYSEDKISIFFGVLLEDTTVCIRVTGLMFSAGHKNTQHATAKECVRKKQVEKERQRAGEWRRWRPQCR